MKHGMAGLSLQGPQNYCKFSFNQKTVERVFSFLFLLLMKRRLEFGNFLKILNN